MCSLFCRKREAELNYWAAVNEIQENTNQKKEGNYVNNR